MGWLSYAPAAVRNPAEAVEARLARTMVHAEAFVAAMASVKGPTLRIWTRPGTAEVRVYFPMKFGYLSVGQDGTLSEVSRGQQTLAVSGMWPAWQALYRKAKKIYLEGLDRRIAAEWAAHEAEVAEEGALLRQREQEKEEQALYEQMLEKAYRNPRPARRNAGLSKREKMMVAAGVMEAPPEGYIKPGTFGPFVPMVGKFKYKVKMDGPQEYLDVALYEGTKRVGRLQLSPVGRRSGLTAQCLPLVEALGAPEGAYGHLRAWYVDWSEVNEDRRGQGLGRLLYDAALDAMFKATGGYRGSPGPFVFVPGDCSTISSTSALARRVWPSLARDYPHRSYDSQTIAGEKVSVYAIRVDHPPVFRLPKPSPARAAANGRPARRNAGDAYPWDASTKVQSLQFDKDGFTADEAKDWARRHGFKRGRVEVGQGNWLRIRQADPEHFRPSTFRVIPFREGVQAVIAVPKRGHR
jgi:GNAT superfamily N-acetyltransferase